LALFREEEGLVFIDLNANQDKAAFLAQDQDRVSRKTAHIWPPPHRTVLNKLARAGFLILPGPCPPWRANTQQEKLAGGTIQ
jgi:hypothetical protein